MRHMKTGVGNQSISKVGLAYYPPTSVYAVA